MEAAVGGVVGVGVALRAAAGPQYDRGLGIGTPRVLPTALFLATCCVSGSAGCLIGAATAVAQARETAVLG